MSSSAPARDDKGYYHLPDDTRLMSVTTITEHGVPKPGLVHWAAIEVARSAVENIPWLSRTRGRDAREQAYEWLRRAALRKRDEAAEFGGLFHDYAEAHILERPMPDPGPDMRPFVDALHRFLDEHQPVFHAAEMVVANTGDRWAGRLDAVVQLPRYGPELLTLDWKSGRKVYDEAALQLSAYRRAKCGWLRDGTQVTPPATEGGVVVHVRPDAWPDRGGYRLYKVDTSDEVYDSFLAARDVAYGWTRRERKRAVTVLDLPELAPADAA